MDARITKSRLANFLSYDWLKILIAVAVAVTAICVFFLMIRPRAKDVQTFTVYAYTDMSPGEDMQTLGDDLLKRSVFSYEILKTETEQLTNGSGGIFGGLYQGAVYTTRLSNAARTVMLTSTVEKIDSEGYRAVETLVGVNHGSTSMEEHGFLNFETYLSDCEDYLKSYFGQDWRTGALNEERAASAFSSRNKGDRRFLSDAQKAEGLRSEYKRLEKLRTDYIAVSAAFDGGLLSYSYLTIDEAHESEQDHIVAGVYNCGVRLGRLANLRKLSYYRVTAEDGETLSSSADTSLILFNTALLADKTNELRYETVSFLSYLVREYGA